MVAELASSAGLTLLLSAANSVNFTLICLIIKQTYPPVGWAEEALSKNWLFRGGGIFEEHEL